MTGTSLDTAREKQVGARERQPLRERIRTRARLSRRNGRHSLARYSLLLFRRTIAGEAEEPKKERDTTTEFSRRPAPRVRAF